MGSLAATVNLLQHKAESLATNLVAKRTYTHEDLDTGKYSYDPRFLIFEFTSDLFLRKRQVDLIKAFCMVANAAGDAGAGTVHQMIMGAGKTTVISPMLALILAN